MNEVTKSLIIDACKRVTGFGKRAYQADITMKYFNKSVRKAEREMRWWRESVKKGLKNPKAKSEVLIISRWKKSLAASFPRFAWECDTDASRPVPCAVRDAKRPEDVPTQSVGTRKSERLRYFDAEIYLKQQM